MTKRVLFLTEARAFIEWLRSHSDWEIALSEPDIVVATEFPAIPRARLLVPVPSPDPELLLNIVDHFDVIDGVVTTSRLAHRWLLEKLPDEAERIHYVRPGVRPPSMPHTESDTLRVGYIGRLDLHVDHESISWTRLHGDYPQLDVILLFSETPNVLVEAMQHGVVPVVARYRGLAAEGLVIDGETGLMFDDADEAARLVSTSRRMTESYSRDSRRMPGMPPPETRTSACIATGWPSSSACD